MSDYKVGLEDFHSLRVSSAERSFLEIFTAKILNAKANKAGIQQEESRLMQEANFRRYGEIVSVITFQRQRNATSFVNLVSERYPLRFAPLYKTIFSPLSLQLLRHRQELQRRRLHQR